MSDLPREMPAGTTQALPGATLRVLHTRWDSSTWLARSLLASAGTIVLVLGLLILIPALLIGGVMLMAVVARRAAAHLFSAARGPNGALDGRRNVRVVLTRGSQPE